MRPPVILEATVGLAAPPASPVLLDVVPAGATLVATVDWTGEPRVTPTFQWRAGMLKIRGATGSSYTPLTEMISPNCLIFIDNGAGTAQAVALPLPVIVADNTGGGEIDVGGFVFEAGVFEDGVFE